MKIQMKPIEVITLSDPKGKLKPIRFRIDGEVVKIRHVNHVLEEQCGKIGGLFTSVKVKLEGV